MRLNKIYLPVLIAFVAMTLQSCLKDQEDVFDQQSNVRMQEYLDDTKEVLVSAENGWLFDYFPDRDLSYGGFLYALKFTDENVTVACELAPGKSETSLYKLCADNGPTLSFDSYNSLMHYFATPSSGNYEALDGDFEFMIMDVTEDLITLRGKRTANIMYLRRFDSDIMSYMAAVDASSENQFFTQAAGKIGSANATAAFDLDSHRLSITLDDQPDVTYSEFFFFTPEGLRLNAPMEINGAVITALSFDSNTNIYSGADSNGNNITLTAKLPDNYALIDEFEGEFTFTFGSGSVDVTLVPDKKTGIVMMKGISPGFDLEASYNRSYGCLNLYAQLVYSSNDFLIIFGAGTSSGFSTGGAGVFFIKDSANPTTYLAIPDNQANSASANCNFILVQYDGESYYLAPSPWRINNTYDISGVKSITKK